MEDQESQDTIVTDVIEDAETTTEEGVARPLSQREEAMQKILSGRQEDVVEQDEPEEEKPDEVILKVDGVEITAPKEKVIEAGIRSLQKESSADRRLKEAAEREAELNARQAELARMEKELLARRDQQDTEPDETGRAFADALFTDEEAVAKTITNITRKLNEVSGKVAEVEQKEVANKKASFDALVKHYHENYRDISTDPDMHFAINRIKAEIARDNPGLTPIQLIDQAAIKVYEKFGGKPAEPANERQKAKQRMPAPTKKASARVEPTPAEKPKKTSDVLNAMRQNRGPRPY